MDDKMIGPLWQFIKDLNRLQPTYSSGDRTWCFPLRMGPRPKDWEMINVTHYKETYYFSTSARRDTLELTGKLDKASTAIEALSRQERNRVAWALNNFSRQANRMRKDWTGVYREWLRDCPMAMRYGLFPKHVLWHYYPDVYRVDTQLGKSRAAEFIAYVRAYKFDREYAGHHKEMTLELFMRYCQVAYHANPKSIGEAMLKETSGLTLYRRLADGRDEGLCELPLNSADAFKTWYHSQRGGGHPWEIYRGGNTTHISLGVTAKSEGWSVYVAGSSTGRMAETIRIALALAKEGLPVEIHDAWKLMSRLLGLDNVGIIPDYRTNHRAAQDFDEGDEVFDCVHLYDLPRNNRIRPFVTWKPIAPLHPFLN